MNLSAYVGNNPLRWVDPFGHDRLADGPIPLKEFDDFSERAEIYDMMNEVMKDMNIDTVWFDVASELNEDLSDFSWIMPNEINELGIELMHKNLDTFFDIIEGRVNETGPDLDNFLVDREQNYVQDFLDTSYLDRDDDFRLNELPSYGFTDIATSIIWLESVTGRDYDFYTLEDRILLGEALMFLNRRDN